MYTRILFLFILFLTISQGKEIIILQNASNRTSSGDSKTHRTTNTMAKLWNWLNGNLIKIKKVFIIIYCLNR